VSLVRHSAGRITAALTAVALSAVPASAQDAGPAPEIMAQAQIHGGLYELAASADGSLWVAATGSSFAEGAKVFQLDGRTLEVKTSIDVPESRAYGMAVNNTTGAVYTTNTRDGNMSAIDVATGRVTVIPNPTGEGNPHLYRIAVDEENNMVYASVAQGEGQVWVVDGSTNTVDRIISTGGGSPTGIIHDGERNRLYVSNMRTENIAVIDLGTDRIIDLIPTAGGRSTQMAFDPVTNRLFTGNQNTNDISVIDLNSMRAVKSVSVGEQPVGIGFHPIANQIYVANRRSGTVTVIDAGTYEEVAEIEIGSYPNTIFIDEVSGLVYVSNKAVRSPRDQDPVKDPRGDMVTVIRPNRPAA